MICNKVLYSLDDLMIEPAPVTTIQHRGDIVTTYSDGMLPIFTSPMPCVVGLKDKQYKKYLDAKINAIIPRTEMLADRIYFLNNCENIFVAFSLDEFKRIFICHNYTIKLQDYPIKVLVDVASGGMADLHDSIRCVKEAYGNKICIMSGNIANPKTFKQLAEAGCDMIRCSVGSGSGCCTATYTGVYYPMASLIDNCNNLRNTMYPNVKIIADGGITNYRDAFKALALGADYVMMGSRLCQCKDSAGDVNGDKKVYFGMASKVGSERLGKDSSAPEGMLKFYPILESIAKFATLFSKYLASTMSYCDCKDLEDFIGYPILNVISQSAQRQFNH